MPTKRRTGAIYLAVAVAYAVSVSVLIQVIYQAELIAEGLAAWEGARELVTHAFRHHLLSLGILVALNIVAALVAYRTAANVTAALSVERRRATELALVSGLSETLWGMENIPDMARASVAAVRKSIERDMTVSFVGYDNNTDVLRVVAEEGPKVGALGQGQQMNVLPSAIRGQVFSDKSALLMPDTQADQRVWAELVAHLPDLAGTRTFALIPMVSHEATIGLLMLRDDAPNAIPASRFDLVSLLAHTIAGALQNARSITAAELRAGREELVNRIAQRSRISSDANEVLRMAIADLAEAIGVSRAMVALGTAPEDLRVTHEWNAPGVSSMGIGSQRVPLARIAAREGETIIVHDLKNDPRFGPGGPDDASDLLAESLGAVVMAPIGLRGQVVGVLGVHQLGAARAWFQGDVRLTESVANELRVAMEAARLFQSRQRENERMLALHHASAVLAGQTDPRVVLEEILRNAVRLMAQGSASLLIWVPEARVLRVVREYMSREDGSVKSLRPGQGLAGRAFQTMAPVIVNDYPHWDGATDSAISAGQQSAIAVPLIRQGEAIGALVVRSYDVTVRFSDEDGRVLTLFADQAVAALSAAEAFEQQRAAVGELERLSTAKSDFISIVSHEFRTPLTGIQGFSEMMRDEDLTTAEIKEYAGDINKDAHRLNRMITDMLDLDRMESGKMTLHPERIDLNTIISDVVDRMASNAPRHSLRLTLDSSMPTLSGDRDKLTQVVTNLLSNAVKYSPSGGEIVLTTRLDGEFAHVSVRDQGLGIPEDSLEKVFERYSRIESGETRHIQGTGLGLPIVRQIVDMHGGRVWVTSGPGPGSDFQFTLPLAATPASVEA